MPRCCLAAVCFLSVASLFCYPATAAESDIATGASLEVPFASEGFERALFWDLQLDYGLAESIDLRGKLGAAHDDWGADLVLARLTPQLAFKLDVVEWVPHAALGPALVYDWRNSTLALGGEASFGVDYLLSRSWALGAQYHFTGLTSDGGELIHRAGLRLMRRWGW